jgi:gamma-glutamylcyclotransferase (GGCT)/AIG2-like uncharacterized protein YtfP
MNEIFVYGTLRRGQPNHGFLAKAQFGGLAYTAPRYTLLDLGFCPGLAEGGADAVTGEVWGVTDRQLDALDALEGHPKFYRRGDVELDDGRKVMGYLLPPERCAGRPRLPGGDWTRR